MASVTVTVAVPVVTLAVNPSTVQTGSVATLTWSSTNATSCTASGAWTGNEAVTVSAVTNPSIGTATLSWVAPAVNTNGSALTTLWGYHIYYGTSANSLTQSIATTGATTTTYEITNLASGPRYLP